MLRIIHAPHPTLTKGVREVKKIDKKIRELVYDMEETLIAQVDPQGVGLAAPQVDVDLAIFIIKPTLKSETMVFINPKILEVKSAKPAEPVNPTPADEIDSAEGEDVKLEGCLSIPKIWGPVERHQKVLVEYQDLNGEKHKEWFGGFKAVIVQHEADHLNGILFTERSLEQKSQLYKENDGELEKIKY